MNTREGERKEEERVDVIQRVVVRQTRVRGRSILNL